MAIKTVAIIGLGALGILFGHQMGRNMPEEDLRIIADSDRIARYRQDGIYCNDELCQFNYVSPADKCLPADLVIFAVKFNGLAEAIKAVKNQVGPQTMILSLLNGITSEEIIGRAFGMDKLIYSVAQGMDAVRVGNRLTYQHRGMICFGTWQPGGTDSRIKILADFLVKAGIPHEIAPDMRQRLWGKFMLNVGVNQVVAVFESNYGIVQVDGPARQTMIAAMREVIDLAQQEKINLTESDLNYWLNILASLDPGGKPSMRQDLEAGRESEVELFAGTVLELGRRNGLTCPVNQMLYDRIAALQARPKHGD